MSIEKQADYIIILSEAGELNTFNTDVESYLREVKGKKNCIRKSGNYLSILPIGLSILFSDLFWIIGKIL